MKKIRIASLLMFAPLALLASCSSAPTLILQANWYNDTSTKFIYDDFNEKLEYRMSFEKSVAASNGQFFMSYPNGGTYSVEFWSGDTGDGTKIYRYHTELHTEVVYYYEGVPSSTMPEVVETYVEFLDVSNELKPLKSWREVHGTAPLTEPSSPYGSLEDCYAKLDYRMDVEYDLEAEEATFTLTDLASEATANDPTVTTIDTDGSGIFFDNEQLIPLLRAADLSASMSMRTIDPTTRTLDRMTVKDGPTAVTVKQSVKLKTDDTPQERDFNAYEITIGYDKQNSGGAQKYTIAQRTSHYSNTYRNVCLKFEYPIIYSQGVLTYKLTAANFYN